MEMETVFRNRKYTTFDEAVGHSDGLVIVSQIFVMAPPVN